MQHQAPEDLEFSGGAIFIVFGLLLFLILLFWLKTVDINLFTAPEPEWVELRTCGAMARHYPEFPSGNTALKLTKGQAGFIRLEPETWSRVIDLSRVGRVNFQVTDTTYILPQTFPGKDIVTLFPGGHVDVSANLAAFRGKGCVLISAK